MTPQAVKQKAHEMLKDAHERRHLMRKYTREAISSRHGITMGAVTSMRKGREPKAKLTDKQKTRIRMDFMRHDDLEKGYMSLDQIALELDISRTLVRNWSKGFGFTETSKKKPKAKPPKVEHERPETAADRFLTMKLTRNPCELVQGYY